MIVAVGLSGPAERPAGSNVAAAGYVRSISTISPGSLSAAYRAMKALEATGEGLGTVSVRAAIAANPPEAPAQAAILSAQGIPAAFAAYGEVIADGA